MNVHTPEFARQYQSYKAVRARLFGVPAKPTVKAIAAPVEAPEPVIAKQVAYDPPLWSIVNLYFDWHVRVWREAVERLVSDLAHENVALRAALQVQRADLEMAYMPRRPTKHIIAEVLENFPGVSWEDIKSKNRSLEVIYPRQLSMFEVHVQRKDMSYPQIGRLFGGRDHSTAIHSVHKIMAMTPEEREAAYLRWQKLPRRRPAAKATGSIYTTVRIMELRATSE
jgi:hypothetical protein